MNVEQIAAVEKIVTAEDYALVLVTRRWKTATPSSWAAAARRPLITYTDSAIDNILSRLPAVGITDFMRIGDAGSCPRSRVHARL